jgi:hypothetical protein
MAGEKKQHTVYKNSKGEVVPSCTTILQVLNTPSLLYWANKIGKEGRWYSTEMAMYGRIGTLAHALIEKYFKGGQPDFKEKLNACTDNEKVQAFKAYTNFLAWIEENSVDIEESELQLVSERFGFGGTIDFYGIINRQLVLLDFKTSNYFNKKMFLQLAGYVLLLQEHGYDVEGVMVLKLSKTANSFEVKKKSIEELEDYFKLFKYCVATSKLNLEIEKEWEWKKQDK